MLWDWDSWLSNVALRQILLENGNEKDREQAIPYEQGCVLIRSATEEWTVGSPFGLNAMLPAGRNVKHPQSMEK